MLFLYLLVHQWLQLEFGSPSIVTGIVTRGRGDTARRQWVTAYTLSYSNDTHIWYFYKELNHLNPKVKQCRLEIADNQLKSEFKLILFLRFLVGTWIKIRNVDIILIHHSRLDLFVFIQ